MEQEPCKKEKQEYDLCLVSMTAKLCKIEKAYYNRCMVYEKLIGSASTEKKKENARIMGNII